MRCPLKDLVRSTKSLAFAGFGRQKQSMQGPSQSTIPMKRGLEGGGGSWHFGLSLGGNGRAPAQGGY